MRKFAICLLVLLLPITLLSGCNKSIDYFGYVSDMRKDIYVYSDDTTEIKIYVSEKETPFSADGIKGKVSDIVEVFVKLDKTPEELNINLLGTQGEMNYQAVENRFYLGFSGIKEIPEKFEVTLTYGELSNVYTAESVKYGNIISCADALNCVIEHDTATFENMTENNIFNGEIFVRLLFDEGCYYYVGVCGRDKKINAYLIDGERGKVITKKQLSA